MSKTRTKYLTGNVLLVALTALCFTGQAKAHDSDNTTFNQQVIDAAHACQKISPSCATEVQGAVGVLVFPSVVKADLIVGGSGGRGALVENNKVTGYYKLGAGSVGLQAGVDKSSQVYIFRSAEALAKLKSSHDWKVGATAGVTLVSTDANASAINGDVLAYVFNSEGLEGGVSLDAMDIWKTGHHHPHQATQEQ